MIHTPSFAGGALAPGLRILSHNIRGFPSTQSKTIDMVHLWAQQQHAHIVCLQETSLPKDSLHTAQAHLNAAAVCLNVPPYDALWNSPPTHAKGTGVAILIQRSLLEQGSIRLTKKLTTSPDGRFLAARIQWRGHHLALGCAYLPSGNTKGQKHMLATTIPNWLSTISSSSRLTPILLGDFNFVTCAEDRRPRVVALAAARAGVPFAQATDLLQHQQQQQQRQQQKQQKQAQQQQQLQQQQEQQQQLASAWGNPINTPQEEANPDPPPPDGQREAASLHLQNWAKSAEASVAAIMTSLSATHHLVDAFRSKHPHKRGYTFYHGGVHGAASRLDRFHISHLLMPFTEACHPSSPAAPDHRPLLLHLRPAAPNDSGKGLPRLRLNAFSTLQARAAMAATFASCSADAPTAPHALIQWWPSFKKRLLSALKQLATQLNQAATAGKHMTRQQLNELRNHKQSCAATLEAAPTPHQAQAFTPPAVAAHKAYAQALRNSSIPPPAAARWAWLHQGERASPLMSVLLRPPASSRLIPTLRARGGGLLTSGRLMANHAVAAYAKVSAQPTTHTEAHHDIIEAVKSHAKPLTSASATAAGSPTISTAELAPCLKRLPPAKSPGPDGIPGEVWRWCAPAAAPLLASLFSAIGSTKCLPTEFNTGAVIPCYKAGDNCEISNYRPITLLNSDYRALAKALANRWGRALGDVIGPEQTAFLPGRRGGEAILFLQLLPTLLARQAAAHHIPSPPTNAHSPPHLPHAALPTSPATAATHHSFSLANHPTPSSPPTSLPHTSATASPPAAPLPHTLATTSPPLATPHSRPHLPHAALPTSSATAATHQVIFPAHHPTPSPPTAPLPHTSATTSPPFATAPTHPHLPHAAPPTPSPPAAPLPHTSATISPPFATAPSPLHLPHAALPTSSATAATHQVIFHAHHPTPSPPAAPSPPPPHLPHATPPTSSATAATHQFIPPAHHPTPSFPAAPLPNSSATTSPPPATALTPPHLPHAALPISSATAATHQNISPAHHPTPSPPAAPLPHNSATTSPPLAAAHPPPCHPQTAPSTSSATASTPTPIVAAPLPIPPSQAATHLTAPSDDNPSPAAVFLDFSKAYDTVSRPFLFGIMEAVGAGEGMLDWAKILLTDTWATAVVNGHISHPMQWEAGVRQGCPLAPAMYLFVGWALSCWLLSKPDLGIAVGGDRVPAVQYADDTTALLAACTPATVHSLLSSLQRFGEASGQKLNHAKCAVVPFHNHHPQQQQQEKQQQQQQPPSICGLRLTHTAKTLGIYFGGQHGPHWESVDWEACSKPLLAAYKKIAALPLSTFGRGIAASSYGISTLLYHLEFSDPPASLLSGLESASLQMVGEREPPKHPLHHPCQSPAHHNSALTSLLVGNPKEGGFGLLPWRQHVIARHAVWGQRLVHGLLEPSPTSPLWIRAARAIFDVAADPPTFTAAPSTTPIPKLHPALSFLTCDPSLLPFGPLHRLRLALNALGPITFPKTLEEGLDTRGRPPHSTVHPAGHLCTFQPLWDHPWLHLETTYHDRPATAKAASITSHPTYFGVRGSAFFLKGAPGLHTVLDAVSLERKFAVWRTTAPKNQQAASVGLAAILFGGDQPLAGDSWAAKVTDMLRLPAGIVGQTERAMRALHLGIPRAWWMQAEQLLDEQPSLATSHAAAAAAAAAAATQATKWLLKSTSWPLPSTSPNPSSGSSSSSSSSSNSSPSVSPAPSPSAPPLPPLSLYGRTGSFTVRTVCNHLQSPLIHQRLTLLHQCARAALHHSTDPRTNHRLSANPHSNLGQLATTKTEETQRRLPMIWRLPVHNSEKEVLWRLLFLPPTSQRQLQQFVQGKLKASKKCGCGWAAPVSPDPLLALRDHRFWSCHIAVTARHLLQHHLPPGTQIQPTHLWLASPPSPSIHPGVWAIVALATLNSISRAQAHQKALRRNTYIQAGQRARDNNNVERPLSVFSGWEPPQQQQQQQQQRLDQHTLEQQRQKARRSASLNILCALQDFASTKILPKGWDNIPANHPFLGVEQDPNEGPIGGGDLTNQHSESGLALKLIVRLSLEGVEL